jgi:hypothetical protein
MLPKQTTKKILFERSELIFFSFGLQLISERSSGRWFWGAFDTKSSSV